MAKKISTETGEVARGRHAAPLCRAPSRGRNLASSREPTRSPTPTRRRRASARTRDDVGDVVHRGHSSRDARRGARVFARRRARRLARRRRRRSRARRLPRAPPHRRRPPFRCVPKPARVPVFAATASRLARCPPPSAAPPRKPSRLGASSLADLSRVSAFLRPRPRSIPSHRVAQARARRNPPSLNPPRPRSSPTPSASARPRASPTRSNRDSTPPRAVRWDPWAPFSSPSSSSSSSARPSSSPPSRGTPSRDSSISRTIPTRPPTSSADSRRRAYYTRRRVASPVVGTIHITRTDARIEAKTI